MKVSLRAAFARALAMFAAVGFSTCSGGAWAEEPEAPVVIDLQNMVDDHFYHGRPSLLSLTGLQFGSTDSVDFMEAGGIAQDVDAYFVAARVAQPNQPLPNQPLPGPNQPLPNNAMASAGPVLQTGGLASVDLFAAPTAAASSSQMSVATQQAAQSGAASYVQAGAQAQVRATTDAGDLLGKSTAVPGVYVQRRNPIVTTPYVRGFAVGQYITQMNGAFWFPAKQDLDTALSKIDSASIQDMVVIKGPFSAMYGPGFAFIDVTTRPTPRYRNGRGSEFASSYTYQSNGNAWYGRQAASGGSANFGWSIGYGIRTGNDYYVGDAGKQAFAATAGRIPSSYKSQVLDAAFGADLGADSSIETTFLHIDQGNVELPGSLFDIESLATNGIVSKVTLTDRAFYDSLTFTTYFNETRLTGDNSSPSKFVQSPPIFVPELGPGNFFRYLTSAEQRSAGYRTAMSWGEPDWHQVTVGTDLRYTFSKEISLFTLNAQTPASVPIPQTRGTNVGLFQETRLQLTDPWSIRSGGRIDFSQQQSLQFVDNNNNGFNDNDSGGIGQNDLNIPGTNSYNLFSGFLTSRYDVNEAVNLNASMGYAERAPTAQELYARGTIINLYQSPTTFVFGQQNLDKERLTQFDVGIDVTGQRWRGGLHGFAAYISDYIGTAGFYSAPPGLRPGNNVQYYRNYNDVTLLGSELAAEYDLSDPLTVFGTMAYVDGYNRDIDAPLPNIFPIQSTIGLRLHDPSPASRWGAEVSVRAVQNYNRVGAVADAVNGGGLTGGVAQVTTSSPGFATGDLRTYYRLSNTSSLTFGVTNFTDRFYQDPLDTRPAGPDGNGGSTLSRGLYQMGRNFYFGADFRF